MDDVSVGLSDSQPVPENPARKTKSKESKKPAHANAGAHALVKKVDPETAKLIEQVREKANKKSHGRKVRDSEIIHLALRQVKPEHIKELQEATLSERDRLHIAHDDYQKRNGKITLDEFIGRLLRGETVRG